VFSLTIPLSAHEQRALYDAVVGAVQRGAAFAGALIGSAGTGKTFVVALAVDRLRFERRVVLCVASTGVASRMYRGGSTAHSAFGIAVDKPPYDRSKPLACSLDASRAQQRYALALGAELIVWDEAYAIDNRSVDAVHRLFCDAAQLDGAAPDSAPFGGMRALLIGDPRQIPPVVVGTTAENAVAQASLQAWRRYGALRKFVLRAAVRQADDADYAAFCAAVGNGTIGVGLGVGSLLSHRRVDVPPTIAHLRGDANADAFQRRVFADAALAACVTPGGVDGDAIRAISRRAIICARVVDVHRWNERVTARLPGNLEHCYSHTQVVNGSDPGERRNASLVVDDDGEHVLQLRRTRGVDAAADDERHNAALYDYLRTFNVSGVPPHDLPLKAGMVLILIRNLAPQDGLTNGTKLVLLRIEAGAKLPPSRPTARCCPTSTCYRACGSTSTCRRHSCACGAASSRSSSATRSRATAPSARRSTLSASTPPSTSSHTARSSCRCRASAVPPTFACLSAATTKWRAPPTTTSRSSSSTSSISRSSQTFTNEKQK
jgi:ATP-dependent DNA helicase PIF1